VADGAGGAIFAWGDYRNDTYRGSFPNHDLYAHRLLAGGGLDPAWPAGGTVLCTAGNNQHVEAIIADGAGGAIVVWGDNRAGSRAAEGVDIYAQRVQPNGQLGGAVVVVPR